MIPLEYERKTKVRINWKPIVYFLVTFICVLFMIWASGEEYVKWTLSKH